MPANSRAIQSGAAQYTATDALPIDGRMGERKTRGQSSGCSFALHTFLLFTKIGLHIYDIDLVRFNGYTIYSTQQEVKNV